VDQPVPCLKVIYINICERRKEQCVVIRAIMSTGFTPAKEEKLVSNNRRRRKVVFVWRIW